MLTSWREGAWMGLLSMAGSLFRRWLIFQPWTKVPSIGKFAMMQASVEAYSIA